jgi:hypothetical protein
VGSFSFKGNSVNLWNTSLKYKILNNKIMKGMNKEFLCTQQKNRTYILGKKKNN